LNTFPPSSFRIPHFLVAVRCALSHCPLCAARPPFPQDELNRGWRLCKQLELEPNPAKQMWGELFEFSDFFIRYKHYLELEVFSGSEAEQQQWAGWAESRFRKVGCWGG
jgi:hypothetical protein